MSMPIITPGTTTRIQAISDTVESVALEQTALAHIINAEGEKIQAVVAHGTVEQMVEVNASVESMLGAISQLEMILQAKLGLFSDCLCLPVPCSPLLDTAIQASDPLVTVHKNSFTDYTIDLGLLVVPGRAGTLTILTNPSGLPVAAIGTLPTGVTLVGNVLSYTNSNLLRTILLSVGAGTCAQMVTVNFITETP